MRKNPLGPQDRTEYVHRAIEEKIARDRATRSLGPDGERAAEAIIARLLDAVRTRDRT